MTSEGRPPSPDPKTTEWARQEFAEGDVVEYRPGDGTVESGVVTSVNARFVFVRFGNDTGSKACDPRDITRMRLEWS